MDKQSQKHFSFEQIDRYVNGEMDDEGSYEVDYHLGSCEECAQKIRTIRALNFVWNKWTARSHGEAGKNRQFIASLKKAAADSPKLQGRVSRWLEQWGASAGGAVKVVLQVPDEITRIITSGLESLLKPQPQWRFAYASALPNARGLRTRGVPAPKDKTKVRAEVIPGTVSFSPDGRFAVSGSADSVMRPWEPDRMDVPVDGPIDDKAFPDLQVSPASINAEISVDEPTGTIEVKFNGLAPDQPAPLVILISEAEDHAPLLLAPEYDMENGAFIARFQNIPAGKYSLAIEPV